MDFVATAIYAHVFTIYLLLGIMVFNYYTVLNINGFVDIAQRLRKMTPAYHGLNFTAAYTGAIVAAYSHDLSPTVIFMIISTLVIMILEIKRYKKMRVIRSTDLQEQEDFVIYAKKIYLIEVSVLIFTFVISKIF
ncbi:MAG: hypothetical protein DRG78_14180 [Epsilonproteobacteria bacterium]|nr:MAG: hypothetical protein DRG78_14180 [Campylobacterota bacterium]